MVGVAETGSTKLPYADLDLTATNIYAMCQNQQKVVEESLNSALNTARYLFESMGEVKLAAETVTWSTMNQFSNPNISHYFRVISVRSVKARSYNNF